MPKTTKRSESKRAARIARAHATELQKLEVKRPEQDRRPAGYKPPARGIARYPWAAFISICLIALGIFTLYANHIGPFALPKAPPPNVKATATAAAAVFQKSATAAATTIPSALQSTIAASPCNSATVLKEITNTSGAPSAADSAKITRTYSSAPKMSIDTKKVYCAGFNTNRGLIVVELNPAWAPETVNNFVYLAQHQFYDGLTFHRVIQTGTGLHIIQGGDPKGDGSGGPGYKFKDEPVKENYYAGTIAMANSGANTNGSQFFINTADNSKGLAKSYNLFGIVVKGLDVALQIQGPGDDAATKGVKPDVMNHEVVVAAP